jgi:hypothetical protein
MEQAKRNAEANRDSHHKSTDSCRYAWMQTCIFVMTVKVKSLLHSEDGNTFTPTKRGHHASRCL